jgi:hypothetical protein
MIYKNIKQIFYKIIKIFLDQNEKKFIDHNKVVFNKSRDKNKNNKILIEISFMQSSHIALSHFQKVLSQIYSAEPVGYYPRFSLNLFKMLKLLVAIFKIKKIYQSFGINKFLNYNISNNKKNLAKNFSKKLLGEINSTIDLENLTIDGIWVGDLIYDEFLAIHKVATVNVKSEKFKKLLYEFSIIFFYWKDLFSKGDIKALAITHTCYFLGLPARIAIAFDIPVYQANIKNIYYLSKENIYAYNEFHTFKETFEKLDPETKKKGILQAKERLKLVFEGKTNVDQHYIENSAFHQKKNSIKFLSGKNSIKVLIASHSFYDSPHGLGINLFPDFYEWLEFLGDLSNKTNYDWYIKTHPGVESIDSQIINDFVSSYKKINLIPNHISHHQLIEEGINIVLTIYGSIALEYAAKNITVINASLNNPHVSFDFNLNPKTKQDYKNIILDLKSYVNANLFSDDVYKCYYMKYLYNKGNIFFKDYQSTINEIGGYKFQFTSKLYNYWRDYYNENINSKFDKNIKDFILSRKYQIKSTWE